MISLILKLVYAELSGVTLINRYVSILAAIIILRIH